MAIKARLRDEYSHPSSLQNFPTKNGLRGYLGEDCMFLGEQTFSWSPMREGGQPAKDSLMLKSVGAQR